MHVHFGVFGNIVVDDVGNGADVDASRGQIRRHQYADLMLAKLLHHVVAFALHQVSVNLLGVDPRVVELLAQLPGGMFRPTKNDREGELLLAKQHAQQVKLVIALDGDVTLIHLFNGEPIAGNVQGDGIAHERLGQPPDLFINRRRHEDRLVPRRYATENPLDVVTKPDVEHPVHLVKDHKADLADVQNPPFHEIQDAPGRPHDKVGLAPQMMELGGDLLASIDRHDVQVGGRGQATQLSRNLDRQLASGGQADRLEPA